MTKIIAEMASSHNGDIELAKKMIAEAASVGVDIIKFQSWQSKNVSDSDPDKARYQSLELSDEDHKILKDECEKQGVEFLTTIYDEGRIDFLKSLGLKKIKVSSTDTKHTNFLKKVRENFEEVIVSTGMTTEDEIKAAIDVLKNGKFTIMHCVSIYPAPIEKANMNKLLWLKSLTDSVGYSDHTHGLEASVIALGMGVEYIEKHFTLDKNMEQLGHSVGAGLEQITTHSIADEKDIFAELVKWRDIYEKSLGTGSRDLLPEEKLTREKYTGRFGSNK